MRSGPTLYKQPGREVGPVAGSLENHPGHVQAPGREPRLKEVSWLEGSLKCQPFEIRGHDHELVGRGWRAEPVATEKGVGIQCPPSTTQGAASASKISLGLRGRACQCGTLVSSQCPNPGETRAQFWLLRGSAPKDLGRGRDPRLKAAVIADMHPHTVHTCTHVVHVFMHIHIHVHISSHPYV